MKGVNKVIIVGNLGNDPEVKYNQAGLCVTRISIATTETWKDKKGERQEKTSWHRVIFFGKLAEIAGEYLEKGRQVYVEGRLNYRDYDRDGVTVYVTEIIGEEMQMLGSKSGGGERKGPPTTRPGRGGNAERSNEPADDSDPFPDDDIPF